MESGSVKSRSAGEDQTVFFTKLHGCGNDYIFVRTEEHPPAIAAALRQNAPELSRLWSHRQTGVGADGLVLVESSPGADARLVMFNSDGSRGALCVNALRCVARLTHEASGKRKLLLASDCGVHRAEVRPGVGAQYRVRVELAPPSFEPEAIPLDARVLRSRSGEQGDLGSHPGGPIPLDLPAGGARWTGWALSVGNPHLIVPLETDPAEIDVVGLGRELEKAACFPDRVNVTFAWPKERGLAVLRTFERGSGETAACGSGACAAAVVLTHRLSLMRGSPWRLQYPGGDLEASWEPDSRVLLEGPAEVAYRGQIRWPAHCPVAPPNGDRETHQNSPDPMRSSPAHGGLAETS